jgi:putative aminopeptidase FrvX
MELLKELTEANGIPGYEGPIRSVVRAHLESLGKLSQDKIGSVICQAEGSTEAPKVMLVGHMDEIGFMVKHITKEGFIHFLPLGGWFDQVLLGQRVAIKTSQDEVGVRGATTSVRAVDPDVAIVLESDIAGDVPGIKPEESSVKLGQGPTVMIYDARMIPNIKLRNFLMDTAEEIEVPLQVSYVEGGATDGAAIHLHNTGVPTVVIGVAARHIHSDSSIIHREDYDNAVKLLVEVLKRLDADIVADFTA